LRNRHLILDLLGAINDFIELKLLLFPLGKHELMSILDVIYLFLQDLDFSLKVINVAL
jgi:hypothetical protein